jgi:NAD-dependent SIR2 family protein deacetylase
LKAGVKREKVVHAHGSISSAACSTCYKTHDLDKLNASIKEGKVMYCEDTECKKPVKPSVVLYGENLPPEVSSNFEVNQLLINLDLTK